MLRSNDFNCLLASECNHNVFTTFEQSAMVIMDTQLYRYLSEPKLRRAQNDSQLSRSIELTPISN